MSAETYDEIKHTISSSEFGYFSATSGHHVLETHFNLVVNLNLASQYVTLLVSFLCCLEVFVNFFPCKNHSMTALFSFLDNSMWTSTHTHLSA